MQYTVETLRCLVERRSDCRALTETGQLGAVGPSSDPVGPTPGALRALFPVGRVLDNNIVTAPRVGSPPERVWSSARSAGECNIMSNARFQKACQT